VTCGLAMVIVAVLTAPGMAVRGLSLTSDHPIRLNTLGFLPDHDKRASIAGPCKRFSIVEDGSERVVFTGTPAGPIHNPDTNEDLYVADFSALKRPGVYRLDADGIGKSAPFRIGNGIYEAPFRTVVRAMYLWRCGAAVSGKHNGTTYSHAACHIDDAWLDYVGGGHTQRNATGGWHDAGDYNKYVVNAGVTLGTMFLAWEMFSPQIQRIKLDLPAENRRLPDYLSETKWEMDWLLKMQAADGSVYHKVTTKAFGAAIQPEQEKTERFVTPWGSAATADFVALAATAARVYRPYDEPYARQCLDAARRSYGFLRANPANHPADLTGFSTGAYQTTDPDDRLWAAAELWNTTGDQACLSDFEERARAFHEKFTANWGWGDVRNLGMLAYLFSNRSGKNAELVRQIKESLKATADSIVRAREVHGYGRPLGAIYYWGCNGGVANTTVILQSANRLNPDPRYVETSLDAIGHVFGRNYYGRSFVTGLGADPPLHPHDRRSMEQPGAPTWPGYLVGGATPGATDWKDESPLYRLNEIAINWNAALIFALASAVAQTV
jgi:endoglucanase